MPHGAGAVRGSHRGARNRPRAEPGQQHRAQPAGRRHAPPGRAPRDLGRGVRLHAAGFPRARSPRPDRRHARRRAEGRDAAAVTQRAAHGQAYRRDARTHRAGRCQALPPEQLPFRRRRPHLCLPSRRTLGTAVQHRTLQRGALAGQRGPHRPRLQPRVQRARCRTVGGSGEYRRLFQSLPGCARRRVAGAPRRVDGEIGRLHPVPAIAVPRWICCRRTRSSG